MSSLTEATAEDDFSFALSLQLQLLSSEYEDDEATSSIVCARSLLKSDFENYQQIEQDKRLAQSLYRAAALDGEIIERELQTETQVQQDRALAVRFEQNDDYYPPDEPAAVPAAAPRVRRVSTDPTVQAFYENYVIAISSVSWNAGCNEATSAQAGSAIEERTKVGMQTVTCNTCYDIKDTFDVIRLECNHYYCLECLYQYFANAMQVENKPPRCCKELIPAGYAADALKDHEIEQYVRIQELNDTSERRIKCSAEGCDAFVFTGEAKNDIGICLECDQSTCVLCAGKLHGGDCPEDTDTQSLLNLAEEKEWQRCYSCREMVELKDGCYHIYCTCGKEFCYICGAPWKTCRCEIFTERFLMTQQQTPGHGHVFGRRQLNSDSAVGVNAAAWRMHTIEQLRAEAGRRQVTQRARVTALQLLRRERRKDREQARVQRMILNAERLEKLAYSEEQKRLEKQRQSDGIRKLQIRRLFIQRLILSRERILSAGKGKGKAVPAPPLKPVVERLVEYTLVRILFCRFKSLLML